MKIPVEVGDLTPEWLTDALQAHAPGAVVEAVSVLDTSSGTTGRARLGLTSSDERIPSRVFVKLPPFTPERRVMVNMVGMGVSEARFYEEIAPWLPVRTPRALHAAHDLEDNGYIMIFEDLSLAGARQPTQEEPDAFDFASQVMGAMASFHAHMWMSPRLLSGGDLHWLADRNRGGASEEGQAIMRMGLAAFGDQMPPVFHQMAEIYIDQNARLSEVLFEGPYTLVHGDTHIGNMLRDEQGPILLDWAMVRQGPSLRDVAYFIANSIPHEVRQKHEEDLLRTYLAALAGHGIEIPWNEAWDSYRLQTVSGWIAASTTAALGDALQPLDVSMRATERSNLALEELDVVPLLRKKLG